MIGALACLARLLSEGAARTQCALAPTAALQLCPDVWLPGQACARCVAHGLLRELPWARANEGAQMESYLKLPAGRSRSETEVWKTRVLRMD